MKKIKVREIFLLTLILFIISLIITIWLYIKMNNQDINYEIVSCQVEKIEKKRTRIGKYRNLDLIIMVSYNDNIYTLQNDYDESWLYYKGNTINAYLSNNKLYANEAGIRADTKIATIYFTFIYITLFFFTNSLIAWCYYKKSRNNLN